MKKKAVVLLITIGFIGILSALILQSVTISKASFDELINIKKENQIMLIVKNINDILKKQSIEDIKQYFVDKAIPITDEKSGLNIIIHCIDLNKRLNLNKLLKCKKDICKEVILKYLDKKELADSEYFYKLLKEISNNTKDSTEFIDDEIYKGDIVNFTSIEKVKEKYLKQIRDNHEEKITKKDFEDIFYLSDKNIIDSNLTTDDENLPICRKLDFREDESEDCLNYINKIKNNLNNNINSGSHKSKSIFKTKNLLECRVKLYKENSVHKIVLKYNLSKGKNQIVSIDEFF